jgi:predicted dehydrogenase
MTESRTPPYRVGMIGVGRKGTSHARAYVLNPKTEVVAAADPDPENLELFRQRFGVPVYSDYHEMLRVENIDIAAPILPVSANPQVVIDCAMAGVGAIFSEKPIASSLAEADQMVEECRSRGIPFASGDSWRNLPQFWQFKEMIVSGQVGDVRAINVYHPHNEILGGGCQSLSVSRLMADDADVEWVVGWVRSDPWDEEDQGMGGVIRFANGILAHVHMDEVGKRGIEVLTSKGVFFCDWVHFTYHEAVEDPKTKEVKLQERKGLFEDAGSRERAYDDEGWREAGYRQKASVQAIIDALESGSEPRTSGDNMRKGLEIGIALRESHRQGHAPIKLPIEDRSMKILPHAGRMFNKKEIHGREWYMEQIMGHKRES